MQPILKWAGGKRQMLPEIRRRVPREFGTYLEPFLGGGAVFFDLLPERALLGDVNEALMATYANVMSDPLLVHDELTRFENTPECYRATRDVFNDGMSFGLSSPAQAARLIYLNKACFNGLWRVNPRTGAFNVPYGRPKRLALPDLAELSLVAHELMRPGIRLALGHVFTNVTAHAARGDFVYLDPPYVPISNSESFTGYVAEGFDIHDQYRLYLECRRLHQIGAKFLLSQSCCRTTLELYDEFTVEKVEGRRSIGRGKGDRKRVKELLVRNYATEGDEI